jgi:hypothetical protein
LGCKTGLNVALDGGLVGRGVEILEGCVDGPSLDGDAMRGGGRPNVPNVGLIFCGLGEPAIEGTRDRVVWRYVRSDRVAAMQNAFVPLLAFDSFQKAACVLVGLCRALLMSQALLLRRHPPSVLDGKWLEA